jgi:hypothetical protein
MAGMMLGGFLPAQPRRIGGRLSFHLDPVTI